MWKTLHGKMLDCGTLHLQKIKLVIIASCKPLSCKHSLNPQQTTLKLFYTMNVSILTQPYAWLDRSRSFQLPEKEIQVNLHRLSDSQEESKNKRRRFVALKEGCLYVVDSTEWTPTSNQLRNSATSSNFCVLFHLRSVFYIYYCRMFEPLKC